MTFVPTWGDKGLLVAFGYLNQGNYQPDMTQIPVYDVAAGQWFNQTVTGDIPMWRNWFCSAGVQSTNKTFEIILYGGFVSFGNDAIQYDDVHVLTLPSFHWIHVPYAALHPRGAHSCTPVGAGQILVVGGDNPSFKSSGDFAKDANLALTAPDPWKQGLGIFNLSSLSWQEHYDSSNHGNLTYRQSDLVQQHYAQVGQ